MNGIGFAILILLGAAAVLSAVYQWEVRLCRNGQDDTRSDSSHSPSQPGAEPATYAESLGPRQPIMWCPVPEAAATRSTTSDQHTAYATADAVTATSSGSDSATARISSTQNNHSSSGSFSATEGQDISRQPVHFFSSKKNLG